MRNYDIAKERLERRGEHRRSTAAAWAASVAAAIAFALALLLLHYAPSRAVVIIEPALALTLSAGLTLGARALDGPFQLGGRRRDAVSTSRSAAALLLWLGCFCAIQVAFLVVGLAGRWNAELAACPAGAKDLTRASITLLDGTQRTISITDCDPGKRKRDGNLPSRSSKQSPTNADVANEEPVGGET